MTYTQEQTATIHEQTFAYLEIAEKEHVLTITLNRPAQRNALNEVITREIAYALSYAHYTKEIWAVVLQANGKIFCAGADLKMFLGQKDTTSGSTIPEESAPIIIGDVFNQLHKPCIAKIKKPVFAGGFLLLGGCTHVVATPEATFGLPEVKRGIWPFQVMASLLNIMPARKVLDWCMQGKIMSAQEALEVGMATHVVADEELDATVDQLIATIFQNSPSAVRLGLKAFQDMQKVPENELHKFLHGRLMEVLNTKDAQEGLTAFKEKRAPNWTGE